MRGMLRTAPTCHLSAMSTQPLWLSTHTGPLLGKIEEVVAGTNSGKSPALAAYYAFWERAIFNALNAMVLNAMMALQVGVAVVVGAPARPWPPVPVRAYARVCVCVRTRPSTQALPGCKELPWCKPISAPLSPPPPPFTPLAPSPPPSGPQATIEQRARRCEGPRRPPLFKVTFSLQGADVVVQPPMAEVNKALGRLVRSLVESTKVGGRPVGLGRKRVGGKATKGVVAR